MLLVVAGLGFAADCMEVTLMAFLGPSVGHEWGMSREVGRYTCTHINQHDRPWSMLKLSCTVVPSSFPIENRKYWHG